MAFKRGLKGAVVVLVVRTFDYDCVCAHLAHGFSIDFSKHRAEPGPPEPHSVVADADPPLMQKTLDIAQRKREPHVQHHSQTDNFGRGLGVAEGARFCHR